MIIHDFYVIGVTIDPFEAYSPLIVDPDTVLPCPVPAELLQPICWRDADIIQCDGIVEHTEFAIPDLLDVLRQPGRAQAGEDAGGFLACEGFDHVFRWII